MGLIYLIHIPSGKKYVGQHKTNDIKTRKKSHYMAFKSWQKTSNKKGCNALYNAFAKYGFEKCVFVLLEKDISLENINDIEDSYILELNTLSPHGYNLKLNNSQTYNMFSDETLKKMSVSQSKVYETKLDEYRRNKNELKGMPKHINFITRGNRRGYRIVDHPNCQLRDFLSSSVSIEELKQKTLHFLKKCEETPYISDRTTKQKKGIPKGILEKLTGYEVQFMKNKKKYNKCFLKTSNSKEENLRLALEWLENLKTKLSLESKEEGPETK